MIKLQSIQKFVAQIVTRLHNITPVPKQLNKWPLVATQLYFRNAVVALINMLNVPHAGVPFHSVYKAKLK